MPLLTYVIGFDYLSVTFQKPPLTPTGPSIQLILNLVRISIEWICVVFWFFFSIFLFILFFNSVILKYRRRIHQMFGVRHSISPTICRHFVFVDAIFFDSSVHFTFDSCSVSFWFHLIHFFMISEIWFWITRYQPPPPHPYPLHMSCI